MILHVPFAAKAAVAISGGTTMILAEMREVASDVYPASLFEQSKTGGLREAIARFPAAIAFPIKPTLLHAHLVGEVAPVREAGEARRRRCRYSIRSGWPENSCPSSQCRRAAFSLPRKISRRENSARDKRLNPRGTAKCLVPAFRF